VKALALAGVNLRRMLRDTSNIFFVFLLPLGIILIIGSMFGGSATPKIGVTAAGAGPLGDDLVALLEERPAIQVFRYDDADGLQRAVERGDVLAGVVVPEGYDAAVRAGDPVVVGFLSRPGDGQRFRPTVEAVVGDQASVVRAARFAAGRGAGSFDQALTVAGGLSVSGISVESTTVGEGTFTGLGQFDLGASSQLLLFMFLTGLTGSATLVEARRLGVSRRMLSTPTRASTVILGEGLGRYAVVLVQGVYIVLVTLIAFQVNWGNPPAAIALILVFGAVCAGAAMLTGALFRNDQQASGVGVIMGLGFAALGGCMVPLEFFSSTMRTVARATPHAWANEAFGELVRHNGTMVDILPQLGALAAFAAGLIGIAAWRLRGVLTRG
jgi:ABC-2 type transport system permease protein